MSILYTLYKNEFYYINYKDCFIGYKEFVVDKDGIFSVYFINNGKKYKRYKYRFSKNKNFGLITTNYEFIISNKSNRKRYLILDIQYYNGKEYDDFQTVREIRGGYLVECFSSPEIKIHKKRKYELPIKIVVPVMFKISDINFFDSESVLVYKFAFIPPDVFEQITFPEKVKGIKNYIYYYNWLNGIIFKNKD